MEYYGNNDWRDYHLSHHGILGMKWGIRRFQPYSVHPRKGGASGKEVGDAKKSSKKQSRVFVSGSSKTQDRESGYYRKKLPSGVRRELERHMRKGSEIIVGDAPGIDRQVQDYLNKRRYDKVTVYGPGKQVRYSANSKWKTKPIDAPEFEVGSKEWLAKKDKAMERDATEGIAVILDEGAKATRKNVERLSANKKNVSVYELNKHGRLFDKHVRRH